MPINYDDYHPKWSLIRRLVLKRAEHKCEQCGVPNYEVGFRIDGEFQTADRLLAIAAKKSPMRIVLTVAHYDHDVTNNRFTNLRAWCQRCHLNHDRQDNARRRKYGKAFIAHAPQLF
ncbi:hypothetical protein [Spirosoma areae]